MSKADESRSSDCVSFGDAKLKPFDYSEFDVIVFDKIHFSNLHIFWRIKQFVGQNKQNKILIATGDCKQLTHKTMKLMLMMSLIIFFHMGFC